MIYTDRHSTVYFGINREREKVFELYRTNVIFIASTCVQSPYNVYVIVTSWMY